MLAHAHRITSGDDYRATVRRGVKVVGAHSVSYVRATEPESPIRFGFIVSKKVGNAVRRNRVRRRLKAASFATLEGSPRGFDVVIRALPRAVDAEWDDVTSDVSKVMARVGSLG